MWSPNSPTEPEGAENADEPEEAEDFEDFVARKVNPHPPDVPDSRDRLLYLDFGFDGRVPVGIDPSFPSGPGADPDEILSQSQALLDAGLAFAARQLLAQLGEPAASSAKACWLGALLLWNRFRNGKERHRRGWGGDLLGARSDLWLQDIERLLQVAVEKEWGFGPAWLSLAQVHLEPNSGAEPSQAVDEALRARQLLGGTPPVLMTLGRALRAAQRPGDAIATFAFIPKGAEERPAAERELEVARLEMHCLARPIDVAAHLELGRWCLRHDLLARAREPFARLVEIDRPEGFWGLGRLALIEPMKPMEERWAEARRMALAALSRDPQLGLAHELLGMVHHNLAFFATDPGFPREDPLPSYRRAVELDPSCDLALISLAEDHVEQGEIEQAIARLEEAVRQETRSAFAFRLLALLYECTRRYDQYERSLALYRKGDELEPWTELASDYVKKVHRLCQFEV